MHTPEYERLKTLVNDHLFNYLPKASPESKTVFNAMQYSLSAGGKRIRPVLLLAACKMAGGREEDALGFACALEYIHTYSLIHDDLPAMDDDDLRRGKPTNHKVFGEAVAILAGDALLNAAYETMFRELTKILVDDRNCQIAGKLQAAKIIAEAAGAEGMIGGQTADLLGESGMQQGHIEIEKTDSKGALLEFIHRNKTGALMRAALMAGGAIGGADETMLADLKLFGEKLGLAFQVADDILDVCGDVELLGKVPGSDIKSEKLTYPSLFGLEQSQTLLKQTHKEAISIIEKYKEKATFLIEQVDELAKRTY